MTNQDTGGNIMNKKVIGLLLAGVVAISVGGVGRTVYAATDINSAAVSESVNSYVDLQVPALSAGVYDVN